MRLAHPIPFALGLALLAGGALLYWRRARAEPRFGSQAAVLLLVVGLMLVIRGSGLLDYRPAVVMP